MLCFSWLAQNFITKLKFCQYSVTIFLCVWYIYYEYWFILLSGYLCNCYCRLTNLAKSMLSDTSEDLKAGVKHDVDLEAR